MKLYVLSGIPRTCAVFHADIHLRQGIVACSKIISDAIHINVKHIPLTIKANGTVDHIIDKQRLFPPPTKQFDEWSRWAAGNYYNAWWVIDLHYQLTSELTQRLGEQECPEVELLQAWVMAGLVKNIPKPDTCYLDPFPITIPKKFYEDAEKEGILPTKRAEIAYQNYYCSLKGKHRMRWTSRPTPFFMDLPF